MPCVYQAVKLKVHESKLAMNLFLIRVEFIVNKRNRQAILDA